MVYRWEKDGEKTFQYAVWCQHKKTKKVEWHLDWYPRVYDLLYSELLADYPDLPVLVVEGEKTCDAARKSIGDRTSSPPGRWARPMRICPTGAS